MASRVQEEVDAEAPEGYDDELYRIRHSAAHVLAQAVVEHFGGEGTVVLGIGPPIKDGFYYDFLLPRPLSDDDLPAIEKRMRRLINENHRFSFRALEPNDVDTVFRDQPFKRELIDDLRSNSPDEPITVYQQGTFIDLCRGPHVQATGSIKADAIKLLSVAGAYWRGDETRPQLQRIYGTAWRSKQDLTAYLERLAEAERRDHRKLGRELELFHLDPTAPGMPYWLPRGLRVLNGLIDFWRREHEARGYQEISSPLINEKSLWERSGHWEHYKDNMFIVPVDEHTTYGVKPMNCPNAMVVFNLKLRSYRDLPLRLSDSDILHRHERSGTLHGLLRVQRMQQDDAHIFLGPDQIADEYRRIFDLADRFYEIFGLSYRLRLGTRPDDFIGDIDTWNHAEDSLRTILDERVGPGGYEVEEGAGAFYGPKIDILMRDALEREWQMGTIQLDFQLPRRFDCTYVDTDGAKQTPVVIHRAIYGSLERFIGILIEHTAGAFPVWLHPEQARVIPIGDRHAEYARAVGARLKQGGLRVDVDAGDERMNARVREAQLLKIPFALVVGDREADEGTVAVRERGGTDHGTMTLDDFNAFIAERVAAELGTRLAA
jgi:threonyl-tRNA synthetase